MNIKIITIDLADYNFLAGNKKRYADELVTR